MGTDAFGRSIDETPAQATTAPSGRSAPSGVPGTSGPGVVVPGWLIGLLLGIIALGGTAFVLVRAERENRDDPLQRALRGEVVNLGPLSLLRGDRLPAAYAAATRRLRDGELVTGLELAPAGLGLTVRDPGAFQRFVSVDVALGTASTDSGRSEADGLAPGRIELAGVQPAVERVLARIEEETARIDGVQLLLDTTDGTTRAAEWRITVEEVRPRDTAWFASIDGRVVRRADEDAALTRPQRQPAAVAPAAPAATPVRPTGPTITSSSSTITIVRNGRRVRLGKERTRRLQRCLGRASGDRTALQTCLREVGL